MQNNEQIPEDDTVESRAMSGGIFGPLDDAIDFRVNGDSKIEWMREARKRGHTSVADFIRVTMEKEVHGEAHVLSMFQRQLIGNRGAVGQQQDGDPS